LDSDQLAALNEVSEPDHCIAKVKSIRNGATLPGNPTEQHAWAQAALQAWLAAGNSNSLMLTFLTEAALVSRGEILNGQEIQNLLAMDEVSEFRSRLRLLVSASRERRNRTSQMRTENENWV
jgi:hypothetical protein